MHIVMRNEPSLVLKKCWLTRNPSMDVDIPCVSEGPGRMGTWRRGRHVVGPKDVKFGNRLIPLEMEPNTQWVETWRCHLIANVQQTLTTWLLIIHPPPCISTLKATPRPCSSSGTKKRRAGEAISGATPPPVKLLSFVHCSLPALWFPRLADLVR